MRGSPRRSRSVSQDDGSNGWRSGRDPVQRRLRIVTAIVCLGVFVYLGIGHDGAEALGTAALALAAVLVLLGYEGIVRLPYIGRRKGDE